MAGSSLPQSLHIHGTTATNGGQSFAGLNLGTINYANSGNDSSMNEVINSLPTAKDAPFNAYRRQLDPTCLPATRVDLLREIKDWVDGEDSPGIFWLSGLAGTGKSTIAQTVAAEYHTQGRLVASFFFSRAGEDVNHAGKFITSIAYQLVNTIPALKPKVYDAISKNKDIASQSLDDQWHELILGPLSSLTEENSQLKYIIVIDALDECDDQNNVQVIVKRLAEIQSLQGIRLQVLLTSRPEVPIQYGFTQVRREEHQDFVLHDIEPAVIEHDISVFLRHKLGLIGQRYQLKDGWLDERAIARLVQNSGGLFIWAATACRFIEEDSQLAEARLFSLIQGDDTLPPERKLDEIYTAVLTDSVRAIYSKREGEMLHERFRQVVGPIILLQNPLSVISLAGLLEIDIETVKTTLANLNSVLDVPVAKSDTIRPLHPSFRDFLLNPRRCLNPQFHIGERPVHHEMYKHCLQVMSKHLRRDICNLRHPGTGVADLSRSEVDQHIQPHVQYACRFWAYHYQRSDIDISSICAIKEFFQNNFLHWLESLSLLGCVSDAVNMIHILDKIFSEKRREHSQAQLRLRDKIKSTLVSGLNLQTNHTSGAPNNMDHFSLRDIVHDAARFVLAFRPVLEESPLQVYYAALMFSPNTSIIKKTFLSELRPWLPSIPKVAENWSPCLQTLKGHSHSATAVAFSPDGKMLASASDDGRVKLWDHGSRKALLTLKGHSDPVTAVSFSPDSKTLASASYGETVKLWDTSSGKALKTLKGHSDSVTAVTFSLDGKMLASASWDGKVKLWDPGSGKALKTLRGYSLSITTVAFSPDSKTVASGSEDRTVRLWDASSGEALQTLRGHSKWITAVAFSPDGKTIASASEDRKIKLWDTVSGKVLLTLKGHLDSVTAVAFSPDGKTLASASEDTKVKLWDPTSGKALQTFKSHSSPATAVAFSPDGKTLASASHDETIKLWDTGLGETVQTFQGHSNSVTAVAFSLDGKMLASGSDDETVKIWDTSSEKALQTLKGYLYSVTALAFSPDGKTLASASWDNMIKLREVGSRKTLQTLKSHSSLVTAVAFSPDGKTLASASDDKTVKLWDVGLGMVLRTLECHPYSATAVAFSLDGETLASASNDRKVTLWDASLEKVLMTIQVNYIVKSLSFSDTGSYPRSGKGVLLIPDTPLSVACTEPISQPLVFMKKEWIYWKGEKILWLPSEYRPACVAVQGGMVGFGYTSGHVLIFQLAF